MTDTERSVLMGLADAMVQEAELLDWQDGALSRALVAVLTQAAQRAEWKRFIYRGHQWRWSTARGRFVYTPPRGRDAYRAAQRHGLGW